jgi:glycosyltransferase involved in cell wall biosynthesis
MRILFLSLSDFRSYREFGLYQDLIREFIEQGHFVDVICPTERRNKEKTHLISEDRCNVVRVKIPNIQKTNVLEKLYSTLTVNYFYTKAYIKFFSKNKYDIVLYVTPPITLNELIKKVKNKDGAFSYLLLKDIFPQNAVDLEMMKKGSIFYNFFKSKETELYTLSDKIGCMSPANVTYIKNNSSFVNPEKLEVNPNSINLDRFDSVEEVGQSSLRKKYGIPEDSITFMFGGNLGKPQGIDYVIKAIDACATIPNAFFIIVGGGTMSGMIKDWVGKRDTRNAILLDSLASKEYLLLLNEMDVGLVFLDYKFTIPNFPSRLLSYLEKRKPIIVSTDLSSDMGGIAENNGFGYYAKSNDVDGFKSCVNDAVNNVNLKKMGEIGFEFMKSNYSTLDSVNKIVEAVNNR